MVGDLSEQRTRSRRNTHLFPFQCSHINRIRRAPFSVTLKAAWSQQRSAIPTARVIDLRTNFCRREKAGSSRTHANTAVLLAYSTALFWTVRSRRTNILDDARFVVTRPKIHRPIPGTVSTYRDKVINWNCSFVRNLRYPMNTWPQFYDRSQSTVSETSHYTNDLSQPPCARCMQRKKVIISEPITTTTVTKRLPAGAAGARLWQNW